MLVMEGGGGGGRGGRVSQGKLGLANAYTQRPGSRHHPHDATHPANSGFVTLPNSMQAKIPPGLRTRYASLRTAGMSVQLRIPKAIV